MNDGEESAIQSFGTLTAEAVDSGSATVVVSLVGAQAVCAEITALERAAAAAQKAHEEQRSAAALAKRERDETLEQFGDLKTRLHCAEIDNAEQRGYLRRVAEDDIARDGYHAIETSDGTQIVPRRPPPFRHMSEQGGGYGDAMMTTEHPSSGRKRVHWVNYGR